MDKTILHIDFDSFFASVEQQRDPLLRGRPIGVTATNGRTCIIAASKEAKALGIHSPSRTWEALMKVPDMTFVPAHFEYYWEITQKFIDICKDYSPLVELFSLDEVFIDTTSTNHLFGDPYKITEIIKKRIRKEIGEYITVSVGFSYNKLLAKLASGLNKPNGFFEINSQNLSQVWNSTSLIEVCGIGHRVEQRLNDIGIYTLPQLREAKLDYLIGEFGRMEGYFLKSLGKAEDNSKVVPYYFETETKSVSRDYCVPQNLYNQRQVLQHVYELCEEVGIKLRRLGKKGRTVSLYLGGNRSEHGQKSSSEYIDSGEEIFKLCKALYGQWGWDDSKDSEDKMVRQISVRVGNLEDCQNLTLPLFSETKKEKTSKIIDAINEKFGDHTIKNGYLLYAPNLKTVPNGYMADRFERSKLVQTSI